MVDDTNGNEDLIYTSAYNASISRKCNEGLNYYYGTNGYEQDHERAYDIFLELGQDGDQDACVQLGCMYFLGHAVDQNHKEALDWWMKAGDHDEALYGIGMIYHQGSEEHGIQPDSEKAIEYWERASEMFNEAATAALYKYYRNRHEHKTVNKHYTTVVDNTEVNITLEEHMRLINEQKQEISDMKFQADMMRAKFENIEKNHKAESQHLTSLIEKLTGLVTDLTKKVVSNQQQIEKTQQAANSIIDRLSSLSEGGDSSSGCNSCNCSPDLLQNILSQAKQIASRQDSIEQSLASKSDDTQSEQSTVKSTRSGEKSPKREKVDASRKVKPKFVPQRTSANLRGRRAAKKNLKAYLELMMNVRKRKFGKGAKKTDRELFLEVFKTFDKDGGGTISADEFKNGMMTLGVNLSKTEVKELMSEVDGDGNGEIDYEEFVDILLSQSRTKMVDVEDEKPANTNANASARWKKAGNTVKALSRMKSSGSSMDKMDK